MTDVPPTLDLEGLSLLVRDAVSLPWKWVQHEVDPERPQWSIHPGILIADETDGTPGGDEHDRANATYLIAAVNTLPALIAEIRRLREEVEEAESRASHWSAEHDLAEQRATAAEAIVDKLLEAPRFGIVGLDGDAMRTCRDFAAGRTTIENDAQMTLARRDVGRLIAIIEGQRP